MSDRTLPDIPSAIRADFAQWAIYPTWSTEEIAALSFGIDPDRVSALKRNLEYQTTLRPVRQQLDNRRRLIDRHRMMKRFRSGLPPADILDYLTAHGISFPDELARAVDELAPRVNLQKRVEEAERRVADLEAEVGRLRKSPPTDTRLDPRERASLVKMVIGMAVGYYGYDPVARRNSATSDIVADLERVGLPVDADTVRKYLREGREILPPPEAE